MSDDKSKAAAIIGGIMSAASKTVNPEDMDSGRQAEETSIAVERDRASKAESDRETATRNDNEVKTEEPD